MNLGFLKGMRGKDSSSRLVMFGGVGLIFAVWAVGMAWIILASSGKPAVDLVDLWTVTGFGRGMDWALVAMFGTILPYLWSKTKDGVTEVAKAKAPAGEGTEPPPTVQVNVETGAPS